MKPKLIFSFLFLLLIGCNGGVMSKPILLMKPDEIFTSDLEKKAANSIATGDIEQFKNLIDSGLDINKVGSKGLTFLFIALNEDNFIVFDKILKMGADPNILFDSGNSVTHYSVKLSNEKFLITLLKHGADPNVVNTRTGETPIFNAMGPTGKHSLKLLLDSEVDLNIKNKQGDTPLIVAATLNQYDVVYELLENGADPFITDAWGNDLLKVAKMSQISPDSELSQWRDKVLSKLSE